MTQVFGSALPHPWALVKWGSNQPNGHRPGTTVAYLTDPIKAPDGTVISYEGGLVEFYRARGITKLGIPDDQFPRWHFRFSRPRQFAIEDVCGFFPCGKSRDNGPTQAMIRELKKQVPKNPAT